VSKSIFLLSPQKNTFVVDLHTNQNPFNKKHILVVFFHVILLFNLSMIFPTEYKKCLSILSNNENVG
jgi:hypothetical protein